jgi:hypothetical protein
MNFSLKHIQLCGTLKAKWFCDFIWLHFWPNYILSFYCIKKEWLWGFSLVIFCKWQLSLKLWFNHVFGKWHFVILSLEKKMALRLSVGMNFIKIPLGPLTIKWFCDFCLINFLSKCHFVLLSLENKMVLQLSVGMNFLQITFGPLTI